MVTGYASLQSSIKATNSGAFAYILKPLDIDHITASFSRRWSSSAPSWRTGACCANPASSPRPGDARSPAFGAYHFLEAELAAVGAAHGLAPEDATDR